MSDYILGVDSAIVLDYLKQTQAVVQGLNRLSMPGIARTPVSIEEFRTEFDRIFAGSGKYNDISFSGSLIVGDVNGQQRLKNYCLNKTKLTGRDMLCFLDLEHFFTTDLANDPNSSMQIMEVGSGEAGKNDAYPISGKIAPNGRLAIYTAHMTEGGTPTLAFVDGGSSNDTITDSASGFVTAGFVAGMTLLILDSTSNDAVSTTIINVAAGTLTLASIGELTAEAGVEGMELHGGGL